jgi:hypothetical protein
MLSKPLRFSTVEKIYPTKTTAPTIKPAPDLSGITEPFLKKCTIPVLKTIAREHALKVGGTKGVIIDRILTHVRHSYSAVVVQRLFRGHLVRALIRLLDNAAVAECTNSDDFFSLEPLVDLPRETVFCYVDSSGFRYGFSMISIFQSMMARCKLKNPYNREHFPVKVVDRFIQLYYVMRVAVPHHMYCENAAPRSGARAAPIEFDDAPALFRRLTMDRTQVAQIEGAAGSQYLTMLAKFAHMQQKPAATRILELFMEIDQLGNYTNPDWFALLDRTQYVHLYRVLYNVWHYRSRLSTAMQRSICILGDPFSRAQIENTVYSLETITLERMQNVCLQIFEYLVFGGVDDDHRQIGTLHALSALTVVSPNARSAMPWLYESLGY